MFDLEFLQAVNDWQRGGDADQVRRRGERLGVLAGEIDERFRRCNLACFRQVALEKGPLWNLLAEESLPEKISSWTLDSRVAKTFKGGVHPERWQGVIFALKPAPENIILNLDRLYREQEFQDSVKHHRAAISGISDGILKYGKSQAEVVLRIESLDAATVFAMGGYSSNRETLARLMFQRDPTPEDLAWFDYHLKKSGAQMGPWWLDGEPLNRVLARLQPHIVQLKEIRRLQQKEKARLAGG